jgi:hypothetical protein
LSRGKYAIDDKLVWEGEIESEDVFFFTTLKNLIRKYPSCRNPNLELVTKTKACKGVNQE